MRAVGDRQGEAEERQPDRGQAQADPLAPAHGEAEETLGHDREQHHASGEHRLHDRHGREGERADVEDPRPGRDEHPEREPLRGEERAARAERMAQIDRRRRAGAAVLVEEAKVRDERAGEGEEDAGGKAHEREGDWPRAGGVRCLDLSLRHRKATS